MCMWRFLVHCEYREINAKRRENRQKRARLPCTFMCRCAYIGRKAYPDIHSCIGNLTLHSFAWQKLQILRIPKHKSIKYVPTTIGSQTYMPTDMRSGTNTCTRTLHAKNNLLNCAQIRCCACDWIPGWKHKKKCKWMKTHTKMILASQFHATSAPCGHIRLDKLHAHICMVLWIWCCFEYFMLLLWEASQNLWFQTA